MDIPEKLATQDEE